MRSRRGRGEGSIFRRKDGTWCATLVIGYNQHGRRRRRYVYAPTKAAVLAKLDRLRQDALAGLASGSRMMLATFMARWLEDAVRQEVRAGTYRRYEEITRLHILPHLGGTRLDQLTPAHGQAMLAALERAGVKDRERQFCYAVLHRALQQALHWGFVGRNACDGVARPRAPRPTIQTLTIEQVTCLLDAARGERLHALYVLAPTTGLRQGELLALVWGDVDLDQQTLQVRHTLQEVDGRLWLDEPKTAAGRRRVDLPAMAVAALREHRARMLAEGHAPHREALVFCDTAGGFIRKGNLIRRSFVPLLRRAGLPRIRFHDLRHTAASLMLAAGIHPKVVAEKLGHAGIQITLDTYSHLLPSLGREAAARMDALLAGQSS